MIAQKLFWKLVKALDGTEIILVCEDCYFLLISPIKKKFYSELDQLYFLLTKLSLQAGLDLVLEIQSSVCWFVRSYSFSSDVTLLKGFSSSDLSVYVCIWVYRLETLSIMKVPS